jgi:hypothetical protein
LGFEDHEEAGESFFGGDVRVRVWWEVVVIVTV